MGAVDLTRAERLADGRALTLESRRAESARIRRGVARLGQMAEGSRCVFFLGGLYEYSGFPLGFPLNPPKKNGSRKEKGRDAVRSPLFGFSIIPRNLLINNTIFSTPRCHCSGMFACPTAPLAHEMLVAASRPVQGHTISLAHAERESRPRQIDFMFARPFNMQYMPRRWSRGVVIRSVGKNGVADRSGCKPGDIIAPWSLAALASPTGQDCRCSSGA